MPGRVNISIPPRLIESARAAQYANREVLGGRTLSDRIKARIGARRAAVLRAQAMQPDRIGGALELEPLGDVRRIWRKRRRATAFTYFIEGKRTSVPPSNVVPPGTVFDSWLVYVDKDGERTDDLVETFGYSAFREPPLFSQQSNPRNQRSKLYFSLFNDPATGDPSPVITLVRSHTMDSYLFALEQTYPWTQGYVKIAKPEDREAVLGLLGSSYNPLHAWPQDQFGLTSGSTTPSPDEGYVNIIGPSGAGQFAPPAAQLQWPLSPEFDETALIDAPGYIRTVALELTGLTDQTVTATIRP